MMKNAFYFTSKALLVLKTFKFLSSPFGHIVKGLDKKDKTYLKLYDVTAWLANNRNTNISRSKSNKTMKFGQLIECNMRKFVLKDHTQNVMEELVPDSFLKK